MGSQRIRELASIWAHHSAAARPQPNPNKRQHLVNHIVGSAHRVRPVQQILFQGAQSNSAMQRHDPKRRPAAIDGASAHQARGRGEAGAVRDGLGQLFFFRASRS